MHRVQERQIRPDQWGRGVEGGGHRSFTNLAAQEQMPVSSFPGAHNLFGMNDWNCRALYSGAGLCCPHHPVQSASLLW